MRTRRLASCILMFCFAVPANTALAQNSAGRLHPARNQMPGRAPGKRVAKHTWRQHGQRAMDAKRVRQLQAALIRAHYLHGRPNGVWDERSRSAMARFQADNRWQSKIVPDARALIRLGLGPDDTNLINRDTAAVSFAISQNTPPAVPSAQQ